MTIFKYIILILAGPFITLLLYALSDNDMTQPEIIKLGIIIYVFGFLTVIVSGLMYFYKASFQQSMKSSIIGSEILYLTGLLVYFLIDEKNRAENLMWLPVAAIFIVFFTLPMVLSVSYGTSKIISSITKKEL